MKAIIRYTQPDQNGDAVFVVEYVAAVEFILQPPSAIGVNPNVPPSRTFPASLIQSIQLMEEEE